MIAPFYKLGMFGDGGMMLVALLIGLAFGFVLESAGFGYSTIIAHVFYAKNWRVMNVMFTAVLTCMGLAFFSYYIGILDITILQMANFSFNSSVVGGLIFGVGMVVGGYCPGTSTVALVTRKIDAWVFIGGSFVGLQIYSFIYPWVSRWAAEGSLGQVTLADVWDIAPGKIVPIILIGGLVILFILPKVEDKLYKKSA